MARRSRWWGVDAQRGDSVRIEAFSDGVLAIAITLLILDVHVEQPAGESLASALRHALPEIAAYAASFLQIGIIWANHHSLFKIVERTDQLLLLLNLALLGLVSFLPLPTRLLAEHIDGSDARTAMLLYGGTLAATSVVYNLLWRHAVRARLLDDRTHPAFIRDVDVRYLVGLGAYVAMTLVTLISPQAALILSVLIALVFLLGPSPRAALVPDDEPA